MKKTDASIVILFLLLAALSNNIYSQNTYVTYKRLYVDRDTEIKEGTTVTETLRVRKGATLTVNCKLSMGQNAKLIVEPGGKLHINGGILTNAEEGKTWYGIEVWGDPAAGQNPIDQGWVYIENDSKIKNSVHGIVASHLEEDPTSGPGELTPNPAYAGGIVQAIGSGFINNQSTVWFYAYPQSSASWFTDCDFEINDAYFGGEDPGYFVRMDGMKGIDFTICRFNNYSSTSCFGGGIYSYNSGFAVKGKSTGQPAPFDWEHSKFNNLRYAVYATSGGTLNIPDISRSQFTGNYRGVYFSGIRNSSVEYCDFETGPVCAGSSYGIYLDRSTAYTIEENTFSQGGGDGIGLVVNNSGGDPNRIYRNSFTGLKFGILAQQENRALDGSGLVLKCNTYNENGHDQLVLWDGLFISKKAGIAEGQGTDIPQPDAPAGNLFSYTGPDGTATDIYNEANKITYYYHANEDYPLWPKYVSMGIVIPEAVLGAQWNENSCPPSESGGGTGDTEGLKGLAATSAQKADSVQNIITILKDGGSTDNMKTEVVLSTPPEAFSIYAELMGSSPYISDTVMAAAIEKEEVLPNVMIRDVMVANPHNARDNELLGKIEERADPMPDYMKAQIIQGGGLVSLFEGLQSQRAFYVQQHNLALNALARGYLADTLAPAASIDSLRALLQNENKLAAKQSLVFLDMGRGAWGEVQNTLEAIPQSFDLTEEEGEEHAQLMAYTGIVANLAQEGKGIMGADSAQITALFGIEASGTGIAAVFARNALLALGEISYDEPVLMPDFLKSSAIADERTELMKALEEHHYLRVFPNPASDYLVIAHELEALQQSPYAEIYGLKGGGTDAYQAFGHAKPGDHRHKGTETGGIYNKPLCGQQRTGIGEIHKSEIIFNKPALPLVSFRYHYMGIGTGVRDPLVIKGWGKYNNGPIYHGDSNFVSMIRLNISNRNNMKPTTKTLLAFVLALQSLVLFSQPWPKYYSQANSYDYSEDIIEMYDNGFLMAGNYSTYDGTEYKTWSWLIKTDINGNVLWDKVIEGGDQIMQTNAVEQTMDGGILTCGRIWTPIGNSDPYVMKLNACGEKEWCKIFASSQQSNPWAQDIKETQSGDIVVLVNQYGEDNVEDMDLFKLNSQGDWLWKKTYCSGSIYLEGALPFGNKVMILSNGDYFIIGSVYWEDPWNPGGLMGIRNLFVMIDSTGAEQWVLPFGLQDSIYGSAKQIIEINSNNFVSVGSNWPTDVGRQLLIMRFDSIGNELDFNIIDASYIDADFVKGFLINFRKTDSSYYFGGIMGNLIQGGNPVVEFKTDTNVFNDEISILSFIQHNNTSEPYTLIKTTDNKLLSNSTFKEPGNWDISLSKLNLDLGYDTLDPGNYVYDSLCTTPGLPQSGFIFLDDCDIVTGVDVPSPEEYYAFLETIPIKAFPNPASEGQITFEFKNTEHHNNMELRCFDIYGREKHGEKLYRHQGKSVVDVSGWQKGMYVAVVYSNGLPAGECKFVVQ